MQVLRRKTVVRWARLTVVNVEGASVRVNSFFPSRLKRKGNIEKRKDNLAKHKLTGHAQIVI